jgi:hypothetical protein
VPRSTVLQYEKSRIESLVQKPISHVDIKVEVQSKDHRCHIISSGPLGAIDCEKRAERRAKASGIVVKKNWTSRAPYWSCGNKTKGQENPTSDEDF